MPGSSRRSKPTAGAADARPPREAPGLHDQLVLARSIPVQSVCEHHMLPFVGVAHVAYLPGDRILGPSKLARVG